MNLEEKIVGKITGTFVVESYQRGYRWSKYEIEHLLEDIDEIPPGQNYCLQPVVVKNVGGRYELIDGQQRLTTLYLIMKKLTMKPDYSIEYVTREGSKELLDNIEKIDPKARSSNIDELNIDPKASSSNIDDGPKNLDELFIKKAYTTICDWFRAKQSLVPLFIEKLQKYVTIIWYEVDSDEDSIGIFTRLNIGKINLTNAELVKALFLSRGKKKEDGTYAGNPYGIDPKRQTEIALGWDAMEKGLHDSKFWAFITNEQEDKYPVRMELLFDIMENKPADETNYFTFNKFCERFKKTNEDKSKTWKTIVRAYQQLQEWYNDFDLYHQIGYLVATKHSIKELMDTAMSTEHPINKSAFRRDIVDKIRESVKFSDEEIDYADLNYEQHQGHLRTLLLLFNVETIRQKGDENNRFPFERYKKGAWSLEHINAQNPENLKTNKQWKEWLERHRDSLHNLPETNEITDVIIKIDEVISYIDDANYRGSIRDEFMTVAPDVIRLLSPDNDDKTQMHTLSNMALLTIGENAALSNSAFDVKREEIIKMDRNGEYIPTCTKNVFLKYYSESATDLHRWTQDDRKKYIDAMNKVLYEYEDKKMGTAIHLITNEIRYGDEQ